MKASQALLRFQAWNLRRLIIEDLLTSKSTSEDIGEAGAVLKEELGILQAAIAKNAKVYCLWHHRLWAVDRLVGLGEKGGAHSIQISF